MKLDPERERRLREQLESMEITFREPGLIQWIELAAERWIGLPEMDRRRYHRRMFDLLTEIAAVMGVTIDKITQAQVLAGFVIEDCNGDDGDDDPDPVAPEPDGERVRV